MSFSASRPTPTSWEIDWGDGGGIETIDGSPASVTHFFADGDSFHTILASAVDTSGTFATNSLSVTVENVAPSIDLTGDADVDLGVSYELNLGDITDPGADTVVQHIVNWGDGVTNVFATLGTVTHTYDGPPGTYTITVDLIDEDNGGAPYTGAGRLTVSVNSVDPTIGLSGPRSVDEGSEYSLTLETVPGFNTVSQYVVKWGDGNSEGFDSVEVKTHVYSDGPANHQISVDLIDDTGIHSAVDTLSVTVNDVAPTIELGGSQTVDEGSHYVLTLGPVTDPGADTVIRVLVKWGDTTENIYPAIGEVTHTYADGPSTPTISVTLTDEESTYTGVGSLSLAVGDVAPTVALGGSSLVGEGSEYVLTLGTVVDPGINDAVDFFTVNWDPATSKIFDPSEAGFPADRRLRHTYPDGQTQPTITVDITDTLGNIHLNTGSLALTVTNIPPAVALSGAGSVEEGATYSLHLSEIVDLGTDTVTQVTVNWGDGTSSPVNPAIPEEGVDVTNEYADGPNIHTISVVLTDEDGSFTTGNTLDVEVTNKTPTIDLSASATVVDEGATYSLILGAIDDVPADTVTGLLVYWGDNTPNTFINGTPTVGQVVTHTYADDIISASIRVDLTDEDGTHIEAGSWSVDALNVAPLISINGEDRVNEGSLYTLSLGPVIDPGQDSVTEYIVDWGDGDIETFVPLGVTGVPGAVILPSNRKVTHIYLDGNAPGHANGLTTPTISIDLRDDNGLHSGVDSLTLTVDNVAPVLTLDGEASVDEGSLYSLDLGSIDDPGVESLEGFVVNWGDGTSTPVASLGNVTHRYADGLTFPVISVDVEDDDGIHEGAGSLALRVDDVAPVIDLENNPESVNEGSLYTLRLGPVTDPGALDRVVEYIVHWGDGSASNLGAPPVPTTALHTYDDGPFSASITVDLRDGAGTHVGAGSFLVTVNNVPPTINLSAAPNTAREGSSYSFNLNAISDVGDDTVTRVTVNWGDGRSNTYAPGSTASHVYAFSFVDSDTRVTITADLRDEDGTHTGAGSKEITVIDVDPPFLDVFDLARPENNKPGGLSLDPVSGNLWSVDEDSKRVLQYSPVNGALVGTIRLSRDDQKAKGITVDANGFWILDEKDERVYRYNGNGVEQAGRSFDVTTADDGLEGITSDGSSIWILDKKGGVFEYDLAGNYVGRTFRLDRRNSHAEGITTDGNSLWVVDKDRDKVFEYSTNMDGILLASFHVLPATHPEGIATDGTNIWVVDKDTRRIYRFGAN